MTEVYNIEGQQYRPISKEKAKRLNLFRQSSKYSNFGMLYGGGVKAASAVWLKLFPEIPSSQITSKVKKALNLSKGTRDKSTNKFIGGMWSGAFNYCEKVGVKPLVPSLPCLGTKISTALRKSAVQDDFYTSKLNWAIQASGAEFLSLFLTAIHWLCKEKDIPVQFIISIHDEIWCMVPEEKWKIFVIQFQIAHLLTWSRFRAGVGINDMTLGGAFFSGVSVDDRIRKTPDENTKTPSNLKDEPDGREYTILDVLEK